MKRFHIALGVKDIAASINVYSQKLNASPSIIVDNEYALWRTDTLNFSIRKTADEAGVRHIGWEDPDAPTFTAETCLNGLLWEHFNQAQQEAEIFEVWPDTKKC